MKRRFTTVCVLFLIVNFRLIPNTNMLPSAGFLFAAKRITICLYFLMCTIHISGFTIFIYSKKCSLHLVQSLCPTRSMEGEKCHIQCMYICMWLRTNPLIAHVIEDPQYSGKSNDFAPKTEQILGKK